MCIIGTVLAVSVAFNAAANPAHYHATKGIEVSPSVCEYPAETVKFILYHEEAHHLLSHLPRRNSGESQKGLELEADRAAVARLKAEGLDSCSAVQPVLHLRGLFSFTHPNRYTLQAIACE